MTINNDNLKNPYVLAFCKAFNIHNGETVPTTKYMFWIDEKHDEFRKLHNLPDFIELNEKQQKEFCLFLGL